ncbi:hypothetical protein [Streptomyces sp. IB2014 016-6]|uniref:LexA family protein n=1 Tax=Streptomyces sp. IB2014 016-6 TaxID=2517818 RepID=UPI0011C9893A|nr:hypothetical protein [Streptomyces sp. IB2014 016-6]TXL83651.1 hypothetical protein EW053_36870 [Streptomyces sp. IB2014 016-6]
MNEVPTERLVQILRVIRSWIADHGEGPSLRQIGDLVGLSSTASVAYQLAARTSLRRMILGPPERHRRRPAVSRRTPLNLPSERGRPGLPGTCATGIMSSACRWW